MELLPGLFDFLLFVGIALLWARWAKLDLGLRAPALRPAWRWMLLYPVWVLAEGLAAGANPVEIDPAWREWLARLTLFEQLLWLAILVPFLEEIFFRGAMFAALLRRWGILAAAIVPSLIWAVLHVQYEWWVVASLFGSGLILAMVRWRSGSLYLPLLLHMATNLVAVLQDNGLLGPSP